MNDRIQMKNLYQILKIHKHSVCTDFVDCLFHVFFLYSPALSVPIDILNTFRNQQFNSLVLQLWVDRHDTDTTTGLQGTFATKQTDMCNLLTYLPPSQWIMWHGSCLCC